MLRSGWGNDGLGFGCLLPLFIIGCFLISGRQHRPETILALPVISLGSIQATIHFFKKPPDPGEKLTFLAGLNQDELALAASVIFSNIN